MLLGSTIGSTRAALTYYSENYVAEITVVSDRGQPAGKRRSSEQPGLSEERVADDNESGRGIGKRCAASGYAGA